MIVKDFEIHTEWSCLPLVAFQKCGQIRRPESRFSFAFCKAECSSLTLPGIWKEGCRDEVRRPLGSPYLFL